MAGVSINHDQDNRAGRLSDAMRRSVFIDFTKELPVAHTGTTPYGDPTGTAGDVNTLVCSTGHMQYHVLGTQTILAPIRVDGGLNITQDLTNNDGLEYTTGCEAPADTVISDTAGASVGTFVVGTDAPVYAAWKVKITDVSGTDDCAFGFRKCEAYQANVDDYDEAAFLNVISGNINIETILNAAATTTTDTTDDWADLATKTVMCIVDCDGSLSNDGTVGKVYFCVDGINPTTEAASRFKFDSGELIQPFWYFLNDTDVAEATTLVTYEHGFVYMGETSQFKLGSA